jgi:hypothetical protein
MRIFVVLTFILVCMYSPSSASSDFSIDECDTSDLKSSEPIYAETEEERLIRMDQDFIELLNQFEECVQATNSSFSSSSSQSSSSNSSSNSSASNTASGNETIPDQKEKTSENSSVDETAKNSNLPDNIVQGDNGSTPKDIPDIATDDTTARQLRAEAEGTNNPELKALYWDAYRQYKGIKTKN